MRINKACATDLFDGCTYKEKGSGIHVAIQVQEFEGGITVYYRELNGTMLHVESFTEYAPIEWIES